MTPAVFIDKDGTLVDNVPYNVDPARITLAAGAAAAVEALRREGFRIYVVSNQPGVAFNFYSERELEGVARTLASLVRIDGFYWCTHAPHAGCECRKPLPGMLMRAAREHGIHLARSWMIGDILDDVEAGHRAGCRTCLVDNGNETEWRHGDERVPDCIAPDLAYAARFILEAAVPA